MLGARKTRRQTLAHIKWPFYTEAGASHSVEEISRGMLQRHLHCAADSTMSLFVAGTLFGEIWVVVGVQNVVIFITKCVVEGGKVSSANGRVQFCNFMVRSPNAAPAAKNDSHH